MENFQEASHRKQVKQPPLPKKKKSSEATTTWIDQTKTLTSHPPQYGHRRVVPLINGWFLCKVLALTNGAFLSSNRWEGLKNSPKIWKLWSIFSKLCNSKAFCIQRTLKTKWATKTSFTIKTVSLRSS